LGEADNRTIVAKAFRGWMNGTSYITDLLAEIIKWEIVSNSVASKQYESKQQFIDEVLHPFGARFRTAFHPTTIRGIYEDGETVGVLWDGEGTALDGLADNNTYAWFMKMREGWIVNAVAFFDSIAFNTL
jgi:ketosteroid isomerase-like protein